MRYSERMDPSASTPDRPLRADAARNREKLLSVAAEHFAERGMATSLEEIARIAGVGIGTLYRRFSTRAELIEAVLGERMSAFARLTEAAASHAHTDAAEALRVYLPFVFGQQREDRGFSDIVVRDPGSRELFQAELAELDLAWERMIAEAVRTGAVRSDVVAADIRILLRAHAGIVGDTGTAGEQAGIRFTGLALRSLGVTDVHPLPAAPSGW